MTLSYSNDKLKISFKNIKLKVLDSIKTKILIAFDIKKRERYSFSREYDFVFLINALQRISVDQRVL